MICFPLDNTPYEAKDMGTYLATRTRGVFSSDGNLAVTPGESGLSVSVSPGLAWLKWSDYWGTAALQEQALTLALDTADGALKRIDAIVCRLDKVNNRAEIVVKKGAPSSAPHRGTACTRRQLRRVVYRHGPDRCRRHQHQRQRHH